MFTGGEASKNALAALKLRRPRDSWGGDGGSDGVGDWVGVASGSVSLRWRSTARSYSVRIIRVKGVVEIGLWPLARHRREWVAVVPRAPIGREPV